MDIPTGIGSIVVGNSVLEPGSGSVLKLRDEMVES